MRSGGDLGFDTRFQALSEAIAQISNLNRLNLIIDDGEYTYVHTNTNVDTLHFRQLSADAIVFSTTPDVYQRQSLPPAKAMTLELLRRVK